MNPTPTPLMSHVATDCPDCKGENRFCVICGPTPTPNSPAPVDIARLRELLAKATPGPWSVRKTYFDRNKRSVDADYEIFPHTDGRKKPKGCGEWTELCECKSYDEKNKKNADLIAALRNEAPALLDEVTQLREQVKCLVHNWQGQITRTNAERDKLREEVEDLRNKANRFQGDAISSGECLAQATHDNYELRDRLEELRITTQEVVSERDSLRQQNERLLKEIEELKSRPTGLWKENY